MMLARLMHATQECELILREDYFDLHGNIYCERHAQRPNGNAPSGSSGGGLGVGRQPEKRSTRLMMMTMI